MTFVDQSFPSVSTERTAIRKALYKDEAEALRYLVREINLSPEATRSIEARAILFVEAIRRDEADRTGVVGGSVRPARHRRARGAGPCAAEVDQEGLVARPIALAPQTVVERDVAVDDAGLV